MNSDSSTVLVTGGAGFIGSALIKHLLNDTDYRVVNVDKLTYAADLASLETVSNNPRYQLAQVDIADAQAIRELVIETRPQAIIHLAAESHVDRSITGPADFIQTNIVGTFQLLVAANELYANLKEELRGVFRFIHVSTDEVYGSLNTGDPSFTEATAYDPRSPYSASKAASDHLVRSWFHTYELPVVVTNCSNNYGPWQNAEKLIPTVIRRALAGKPIPIYGDGGNVRDWLHVDDHVSALLTVLNTGQPGETYNIGGNCERTNIELAREICLALDRLIPADTSYADQITFVEDRKGHDRRYSVNAAKISSELGWRPKKEFAIGLRETVEWYVAKIVA